MDIKLLENDISVKQANKLIESIYRMEVNEHKLLLLATKRVNQMELMGIPFNERTKITINSTEYAKAYGITRQSAFDIIREAKDSIYDREFIYLHQNEDGSIEQMSSRWFQARGSDAAKGEISFMFASAVIPLIYVVEKEYTMIDLNEVKKLKSKFAVRLYKYLMRWVNAPYRNKIPYETLRDILGVAENEYSDMSDFRKRVLNIAVKQVKEGTAFKDLECQSYRDGKKISAFSFSYTGYDNEALKAARNNVIEGEAAKRGKREYALEIMTPAQARTFAYKIAHKISDGVNGFAGLSKLAAPGAKTEDLAEIIELDFLQGKFAPYLDALKLVNFTPNKANELKFGKGIIHDVPENGAESSQMPQNEGSAGVDSQEDPKPAKNVNSAQMEMFNQDVFDIQWRPDLYEIYRKKGYKRPSTKIMMEAAKKKISSIDIMLRECGDFIIDGE